MKTESPDDELIISVTNAAAHKPSQVFLIFLQQGYHLAILFVTGLNNFV